MVLWLTCAGHGHSGAWRWPQRMTARQSRNLTNPCWRDGVLDASRPGQQPIHPPDAALRGRLSAFLHLCSPQGPGIGGPLAHALLEPVPPRARRTSDFSTQRPKLLPGPMRSLPSVGPLEDLDLFPRMVLGREDTVASTHSWRLWAAQGREAWRGGLLSPEEHTEAVLRAASSLLLLRPALLLDGVFPLLPLHGDLTLPRWLLKIKHDDINRNVLKKHLLFPHNPYLIPGGIHTFEKLRKW